MNNSSLWNIYIRLLLKSAIKATAPHIFAAAFFLAITSIVVFFSLLQEESILSEYSDRLSAFVGSNITIVIITLLIAFLINTLSRSVLIFLLHKKKISAFRKAIALFPRFLAFEFFLKGALLVIAIILFAPSHIVSTNPPLSNNLLGLGLILFLPLFLFTLVIELFGSFYLLLSKTSIRSSFELAYSFSMRYAQDILFFGILFSFFFFLLSFSFGFIFNQLHLITDKNLLLLILTLYFFQSYLKAFSITSWFDFFHHLAKETTPLADIPSQKAEKMLQQEVPQTNQANG